MACSGCGGNKKLKVIYPQKTSIKPLLVKNTKVKIAPRKNTIGVKCARNSSNK